MDINSSIKKYKEESYIKGLQHSKAASDYTRINNIMSIINIALVSVSGISLNTIDNRGLYNSIISSFIYSSLFLTGVQKYLNYEDLSSRHRSSSSGYSLLYKNIRDNINEPSQIFITQFQVLDSISPVIPEYIKKINIEIPDQESSSSSSDKDFTEIDVERLRNL